MPAKINKTDLAALRRNYALESLSEHDVLRDPFKQFECWFEEALSANLLEPNAFTLSTASRTGRPSARIVLLKEFDARGFVFFTNYESRKGQDMASNPFVSILFFWLELERQVRIEGRVEKVTAAESAQYFVSRPKGSQIGAWASRQSTEIAGREELEQRMGAFSDQYADALALPLPPFWGGYRVAPERFEFWQGRESRLHDRVFYEREGDGWRIGRLSP